MARGSSTQPYLHRASTKDYKEGELLIMTKDDQRRIAPCLKKELTVLQKFQEVAAYLFEFGYDLALSPENNASQSGVFGG